MDQAAIISILLAGYGGMGALFAFILKDERQRVKDLLARLDEKDKVVVATVGVLANAVEMVKSIMPMYEAIAKLHDAKEALGNQKQLYEAIAQVQKAAQLFEKNARTGKGAGDDR